MIGRKVGSYEILERLGEGGMGTVFRAVDRMLDREVALKVIRPELATEPEIAERFRAEARAIARVNHPAIATIYSFLEDGGELFLALEYVRGRTLSQVLREEGPLPWQRAVPLFAAALDGIEHVHRLGIVHRDLKPDNLMLTESGVVKVMDFGIARMAGSGRLTRTGLVIGTLRYMAPEQIRGEEADRRTDVYALGIVLYELLTGRVPFTGGSDYAILKAQIEEAPTPPSELVPGLPGWLDRAVLRALAKDPAERFQTAEDLRAELLRDTRATARPEPGAFAGAAAAPRAAAVREAPNAPNTAPDTRPTVLRPGGPTPPGSWGAVPAPPESPATAGTAAQGTYRGYGLGAGPSKKIWVGGAAAALLAAAGLAFWTLRPGPEPAPAGAQEPPAPILSTPGTQATPSPSGRAEPLSPPAGAVAPPLTRSPLPTDQATPSSRPSPEPRAPSTRPPSPTVPSPAPLPGPEEQAPPAETPAPAEEPAPEDAAPEAQAPLAPEPARLLGEIVAAVPQLSQAYEAFLERKEDGGAELTPEDERLVEELEAFGESAERVRRHLRDGFFARTRNRLRRADEAARRAELGRRLEALRASAGRVDRLIGEVQPDAEVRGRWQEIRRRGQRLGELLGR